MRNSTLFFLFLSSLFICCNNCDSKFIYHQPENIDDGLHVGTFESVNMDTAIIATAVNKLYCGNYDKKTSLYKLLEKYILPAIK